MNMNRIINMVIRRLTNMAINKGIDAGVNQMAKRKGSNADAGTQHADLQLDKKRMRKTAKMTRRLTKF